MGLRMVIVQDPGGEVRGGKGRARNMERDNGSPQNVPVFNFFSEAIKKGVTPLSWNTYSL